MHPGSCVPDEVIEQMRVKKGLGAWKAYFALYSPVEVLPGLLKAIKRAFSTIPGTQIE